jgi:ubiquinone biosynthesis protein UbiJ
LDIAQTLKTTALGGLETALNRGLRLDPATLERLAALSGKVIEIRLRPFDLNFYLLPGPAGIGLAARLDRAPDTVFSGTPLGLLRGALTRSERKELFADDLRIEGDIDTGRRLKAVLDAIDIDWEEQLSRLVGDVAAHQIGNLARGLGRWSREAGANLVDDVDEYLHEEGRLMPSRAEIEAFLTAVDVLPTDTDRLQQRVDRAQQRLDDRRRLDEQRSGGAS